MAKQPVRIASIGLGWVTTNRHIPAITRCTEAHLIGVIDHNPIKAEAIRARLKLHFASTPDDPLGLKWLDEFDAVTIGAPPSAHFELARTYLESDKHVLVE